MDTWRMALCALWDDAQVAIAQSKELDLKRMLAVSPFLFPDAALELLTVKDVRMAVAVRAVHDRTELFKHAMTRGPHSVWAARNPLTPQDALVQLAERNGTLARFWALCNESLPESTRKRHLTKATVEKLTHVGGSNAEFLGRSVALVSANWWMSETPERWCATVRRAIALDPRCDDATLEALKATGSTRWPMLKHRPELPPSEMTTAELVEHGGSVTAMAALKRDDLDTTQARKLVTWRGGEVEAPVLAAAVARFGATIADGVYVSGTKIEAAATLEPSAQFVKLEGPVDPYFATDSLEVSEILAGDVQAWNVFGTLVRSGHTEMREMARAAVKLTQS
jgi:hypothetical protein